MAALRAAAVSGEQVPTPERRAEAESRARKDVCFGADHCQSLRRSFIAARREHEAVHEARGDPVVAWKRQVEEEKAELSRPERVGRPCCHADHDLPDRGGAIGGDDPPAEAGDNFEPVEPELE
jgi:hypothetical protein